VGIDCIIFGFKDGKLSLLLLKRNFEPSKGQWSLMGGFVQKDESTDHAAKRVLRELTGLVKVYMEQVGAFGEVERDPGERVISIAYYALINIDDYDRELVQSHNAYWADINELPTLIFDHREMVDKARNLMKQKASNKPIGFNLLPELFTLTQLQTLYEAIYGEAMDKRNFRKRVAEMEFIEKTDEIDKTGSRRGARLYRMNSDVYRKTRKFRI
jgi:ADP-ribose pyrophosphatase YjhB (NUDIX family)